jgi:hypothetical protein
MDVKESSVIPDVDATTNDDSTAADGRSITTEVEE